MIPLNDVVILLSNLAKIGCEEVITTPAQRNSHLRQLLLKAHVYNRAFAVETGQLFNEPAKRDSSVMNEQINNSAANRVLLSHELDTVIGYQA
ncbi:MAG: hypothetical protein ACXV3T_08445, partial [Halobacteriota archaeon]